MPAPKLVIMHSYFISIESLSTLSLHGDDYDGLRLAFFSKHIFWLISSRFIKITNGRIWEHNLWRLTTRAKNGNKLCWEERKKDGWKERKRSKTSFNGNIGTTRLHFSWAARNSWIYFYHISHHRIEAKKSYFLCITHNNIHVMLDVMCTVKLMLNTMHASYL